MRRQRSQCRGSPVNYFPEQHVRFEAKQPLFFAGYVAKLTKTREDIRTWADALELDDHCTFGGKA